jgi:REP element-mobilizing transposase RayT
MHPTRLERVFERNPIYFVTLCTHERRNILANAEVHQTLVQFAKSGPDHGAWLGAYVLMPDHWHGFVALDDTKLHLSAWVKSLKNNVSKVLRTSGIQSPHWQKGFFDHVLRSSESADEKWMYVRDNPVRAGLVTNWADWLYRGEPYPLEFRHEFL